VKQASSLSLSTPPTGKMPIPQRDILLYLLTLAISDKIRDENIFFSRWWVTINLDAN
jgi:hypothetical protein